MGEWVRSLGFSADEIAKGIVVVIIGLLVALGRTLGRGTPQEPAQHVAITGDVLVIKSLDHLVSEMGALQGALLAHRKVLEDHGKLTETLAKAMARMNEAAAELHDDSERLSRDMRELGDRVVRSAR